MHPLTRTPISSTKTHIPVSTHELARLITRPHSSSYLLPTSPLIPNNHLTVQPQPQPHPHLSNYSPAQTEALLPTHSRGFPCSVLLILLCLFYDEMSHSDYVASVVIMMRIYTLEKTEVKAVLCNRGTASEFSAGLRKTTTNFSWDSGRPGRGSERAQVYSVIPTPTYSL